MFLARITNIIVFLSVFSEFSASKLLSSCENFSQDLLLSEPIYYLTNSSCEYQINDEILDLNHSFELIGDVMNFEKARILLKDSQFNISKNMNFTNLSFSINSSLSSPPTIFIIDFEGFVQFKNCDFFFINNEIQVIFLNAYLLQYFSLQNVLFSFKDLPINASPFTIIKLSNLIEVEISNVKILDLNQNSSYETFYVFKVSVISNLFIKNLLFDNLTSNSLIGLRVTDSPLYLIGLLSQNLKIGSTAFIWIEDQVSNLFLLENCLFTNIFIKNFHDASENPNILLKFSILKSVAFLMNNITFYNNTVTDSIFQFKNLESDNLCSLSIDSFFIKNNNYYGYAVNIISTKNLMINNFSCTYNNLLEETNSKSCLATSDITNANLNFLEISFCKSTSFASALSIIYSFSQDIVFFNITNSSFISNTGSFFDSSSESTVFFNFKDVESHVLLTNCTFQSNIFFSNLTESASSSALILQGTRLSAKLYFCLFIDNGSSDISSAIFFSLASIISKYNYFAGNYYTDESNFYGTLYTGAVYLEFEENKFFNNTGVDGSCFKVFEDVTSDFNQYKMNKLIIINNCASYQAAFLSRDTFQASDVLITNTYFYNNSGFQYSGCFYLGSLYSTPPINFFIIECIFEENWSDLSGGVIYAAFSGDAIAVYFNETIFLKNFLYNLESIYPQGGMSDIWGFGNSGLYFSKCISFMNSASNGGFLSMVVGLVMDENSVYIENFAQMLGGNFFLSSEVFARFVNTSFVKTNATLGGGFFVNHNSILELKNCRFDAIKAQRGGVFMFDLSSYFFFEKLDIKGIDGDLGALIYLTNTNGLVSFFNDSLIKSSKSSISLIYCEHAELFLVNNRFESIESTIYHFHLSTISIVNNSVENVDCIINGEGCVINVFRTPSLKIYNMTVHNMTRENTYDGGFIYSMESNLILQKVSLYNIHSKKENSYGPIILGTSSELVIIELLVENFTKGGFYFKESQIFMYDCRFENKDKSFVLFQDAIYCENCEFFMVNYSSFRNLLFKNEQEKSVISINSVYSQNLPDFSNLLNIVKSFEFTFEFEEFHDYFFVINSNFLENNSTLATVLKIYEMSYFLIKNSIFRENFALDFASCVYLNFDTSFENSDSSHIILVNNSFLHNYAINEAGVLKWSSLLSPTLLNNTFVNNSAKYGDNIASLPARIWFKIYQKTDETTGISSIGSLIYDSLSDEFNEGFFINEQMSGETLNFFVEMHLVDNLNQSILEANSRGEADFEDGLSFMKKFNLSFENANEYNASLLKNSSCLENLTKFNFSCNSWLLDKIRVFSLLKDPVYFNNKTTISLDLTLQKNSSDGRIYNKADRIVLSNTPSSFAFLLFRSNMIIPKYYVIISNKLPNEIRDPSSLNYMIIIPIFFRKCNPGEIYDNDTNVCILCVKTRYNFDPFSKSCKLCPSNADCNGGMNISIKPGFWRSGIFSDLIYPCEIHSKSCLGGYDSACKEKYAGKRCDDCDNFDKFTINIQKNLFDFCEECYGKGVTFLVFLVIFVVLAVFLLVYSTKVFIITGKKSHEVFQRKVIVKILLNFLQTLFLLPIHNVPMPEYMFYYYKTVMLGVDYLQKWISTGCFFSYFAILPSKFHNSLLIYIIAIGILCGFFMIFWRIRYKNVYLKDKAIFVKKSKNALIFLVFFFQPSILVLCFRNFVCINIEGKSFVKFNMEQECWTSNYIIMTIFLNCPLIFLFFFIFPFCFFRSFYRFYKKKIVAQDFKNSIENNYVFLGYRKKYVYWELLIFIRKLIFITYVSLADADGNSIVIAILILNISHLMHLYFNPFKTDLLNRYENYAYFVVTLNYYFLLFFFIEQTNEKMNKALFTVSLVSMTLFFLFTLEVFFYKAFDKKYYKFVNMMRKVFFFRKSEKVADLKAEKEIKRVKIK